MALWRAPVPLLGRSGYVALLGLVLAFATAGQPGSAAVGDTGPRFYVTPPTDSLPDNVPTAVTVVGRELAPRQALVVEECAVNPDGGRVCSKLAAAAARRDGTLRIVVHVTYVLPRRDLAPGSADQACDRRTRYEDCVLRVGDTTSGEELMAWPLWFAGHPGVCEASTGGDHYPNDAAARWSPDGSLLAFVRTQRGCAGTADVMVVRPDGSDLRRLGETNELWADLPATAWAPTGQQLAFGTPAGLTIVDMKTRRKQVVPGTSRAVTPVWSPDGGTIAYFRPDGVGVRQLHLVDVASGLDRLVDEPRADPAAAPAWSPDSKWLAYVAAVTDSRDVILLELATGSTVNVGAPGAADSEPVWATDGSLLFVSDRSGKPALYAVSPGRDTVAVVLGAPTAPRDAAPSPRGGELAVTASLPERALWLVDEEGGNPRLAVRRGDVVGAPSWAPDGRRLAYAADAPCGRLGIHVLDRPARERRLTNRCEFRGTPGANTLRGTAYPDRIWALGGDDRVVDAGGRDRIDAGSGNDTILARDGDVDEILCGAGHDRVVADRLDLVQACERVERP